MVNTAVALRKESVDRNRNPRCYQYRRRRSLSARRAWIEIQNPASQKRLAKVALRKESVDRNAGSEIYSAIRGWSLSARRAWIEIC